MKTLLLLVLSQLSVGLIALSSNITVENMALFVLGTIIYFVLEFKKLRESPKFNAWFWFKDNWYNVILSLAFVLAYLIRTPEPDGWIVFTIGVFPNYAIDQLVNLYKKYVSKTL